MRRRTTVAASVLAIGLTLTGCGGSSGSSSDQSSDSDLKVGIAYDVGGRGDKSYNDAAGAGIDEAVDTLGADVKELEASDGETDAQREERLRLLAQGGYDPVIAVGANYATALESVAADFPDTNFAIVDDSSFSADNVQNIRFTEGQSSYLVGVIAAQASINGQLGFIGGVNIPGIHLFADGFTAGAQAVNPDVVVTEKYLTEPPDFTGFSDPAKGRTVAQGLLDGGADVIYIAAGGSGTGAFQAISAAGAYAIGVDSDQYTSADADVRDCILTSAVKRVDVAVLATIQAVVDGAPLTGLQSYNVSNDGVGFTESNSAVEPFTALAEEYQQKLTDGTVVAPSLD